MASSDKHSRSVLARVAGFLRRPGSAFDANDPHAAPQSVALEPHIEREAGEPDLLVPQIVIDQQVFTAFDHGPIDLSELERSLAADGAFFIWTCECGAPGCAGRFGGVRVEHANGMVRWRDLDTRHHYCFRLADLAAAFDAVQVAARQLIVEHPSLLVTPDQNIPYLSGK